VRLVAHAFRAWHGSVAAARQLPQPNGRLQVAAERAQARLLQLAGQHHAGMLCARAVQAFKLAVWLSRRRLAQQQEAKHLTQLQLVGVVRQRQSAAQHRRLWAARRCFGAWLELAQLKQQAAYGFHCYCLLTRSCCGWQRALALRAEVGGGLEQEAPPPPPHPQQQQQQDAVLSGASSPKFDARESWSSDTWRQGVDQSLEEEASVGGGGGASAGSPLLGEEASLRYLGGSARQRQQLAASAAGQQGVASQLDALMHSLSGLAASLGISTGG